MPCPPLPGLRRRAHARPAVPLALFCRSCPHRYHLCIVGATYTAAALRQGAAEHKLTWCKLWPSARQTSRRAGRRARGAAKPRQGPCPKRRPCCAAGVRAAQRARTAPPQSRRRPSRTGVGGPPRGLNAAAAAGCCGEGGTLSCGAGAGRQAGGRGQVSTQRGAGPSDRPLHAPPSPSCATPLLLHQCGAARHQRATTEPQPRRAHPPSAAATSSKAAVQGGSQAAGQPGSLHVLHRRHLGLGELALVGKALALRRGSGDSKGAAVSGGRRGRRSARQRGAGASRSAGGVRRRAAAGGGQQQGCPARCKPLARGGWHAGKGSRPAAARSQASMCGAPESWPRGQLGPEGRLTARLRSSSARRSLSSFSLVTTTCG